MSAATGEGEAIRDRFRAAVARDPAAPALVTAEGEALDYAALAARARSLALAIASRAAPGEPVALLLERGADEVAAVLGALEAGTPYLPLDPRTPPARLAELLAHSGAPAIVAEARTAALARALAGAGRAVLLAGDPPPAGARLPDAIAPDAPASILYTSGSTGAPKGVVQSQRTLLRHVASYAAAAAIGPGDRLSLLPSITAGASVSDLFGALLHGAALHPLDVRAAGLGGLRAWLARRAITVYHSVPSLFREMARGLDGPGALPRLRLVKLGGEPVFRSDLELMVARLAPACRLYHGLGATEMNAICRAVLEPGAALAGDLVPVGRPAPEVEVALLDEAGAPVAPGEAGEIAITSRYLPLGYWREPALAAAAFREAAGGARTWRTGDLGRLGPDGALTWVGRRDERVKVRGSRVEPAEVEAVLARHAAVREVAVVGRAGARGEMRLVAFVAAEAGRAQDQTAASQDAKVSAQDVRTVLQDAPLDAAHLRALAAERLPDYMVPDRVVLLETLPRLPGGKVDRAALRAIELPPLEAAPAAPAPPRDEAERALILLFEEALARRPLGARDDFLALGGDSLAALGLFDAIERRFGRALPLSTLLEAPTPEALARVLARPASAPLAASPLVAIRRGGSRPPLFLVHTGHGHVLRYRDLARALGDDQPVYGLAARGLDGGRPPTRVHAMAAEYLAAVEALDPAGPYLLGGMCIGGLVAFEMAQQLRARGKRVALLAVIDTFGIRGAPPPTAGEDAAAPPTRTLGGRLAGLLRRGARIGERRARFAAHGLATGIRWLASREARRRLRMARALRQAERSYAPRRYAGEVLLVRAGSDGASPGWERRWVELAAGGLARHVVPGTHADVLRGENVARVAAVLRARIDAAVAGAREAERVGA